MTRAWNSAEDATLHTLLALYGTRWRTIAAHWPRKKAGHRRRSASEMRSRHVRLRPAPHAGTHDDSQADTLAALQACTPPISPVQAGCEGSWPGIAGRSFSVLGPPSATLAGEFCQLIALPGSSGWCMAYDSARGRSALLHPALAYALRPAHAPLVRALDIGQHSPHRLVFCDLETARRNANRSHPRQWRQLQVEMAHATLLLHGDALPTLTGARYRSCWIGGHDPRAQRYFGARDAAAALGLLRTQAFSIGARSLSEPQLWRATTDSLDVGMAAAVMRAAVRGIPEKRRPRRWRAGSLFAGMYDALLIGARQAGLQVAAVLAVESNKARLSVVSQAHQYLHTRRDAFAPLTGDEPLLDVLFWTPPCQPVSTGSQLTLVAAHIRHARAVRETRRAATALVTYARVTKPLLIVGEQVSGIVSHYPTAWMALGQTIATIPYAWSWAPAQAVLTGGQSRRSRVILVGVRLDCVRTAVMRSIISAEERYMHVGRQWLCFLCGGLAARAREELPLLRTWSLRACSCSSGRSSPSCSVPRA